MVKELIDAFNVVCGTYEREALNMLSLSNRMVEAIGLSKDKLKMAVKMRCAITVGEYVFEARSCLLPNGWFDVLMVTPISAGSSWSKSHNDFPAGWYYCFKGTATVVMPPEQEIDSILASLDLEKVECKLPHSTFLSKLKSMIFGTLGQ